MLISHRSMQVCKSASGQLFLPVAKRACPGFWTVCKSASGWPFLLVADMSILWDFEQDVSQHPFLPVADKRMLWVLNSLWVSIWLALPACCWQKHALGFEQNVSQHLAGPSYLLLKRPCSGFWTVCKSASGCSCLLLIWACSGFYIGCKSASGWPFLLVAYKTMLWVLNSL